MFGQHFKKYCVRNLDSKSVLTQLLRCKSSRGDKYTESALIDYLELEVRGGRGGTGCASIQKLLRNKSQPDGADGGKGGSVYFKATKNRLDFSHIPSKIIGNPGSVGMSKNKVGARGNDIIIPIPVGSIVGCQESQKPLAELDKVDEMFLAASGGKGGRGNRTISSNSPFGRDRYFCSNKEEGEEAELFSLYLEMKIIADIGLVGLPNAGKSSLLRAISAAKPKVAAYPFTTLRPHVGIIHYNGYYRLRMADIPGLIEGSSLGCGLGFSFLKHIERCKSLVYVIDMSNPDCGPIDTIKIVQKELEAYKSGLTNTIVGIVANKIDLLDGPKKIIELARAFPHYKIIPVSALERRNIMAVRDVLEPFKYRFVHDSELDVQELQKDQDTI